MEIEYRFKRFGTEAYDLDLTDTLWIDVGGKIGVGAFDNHVKDEKGNIYNSTISVICNRSDLFEQTVKQLKTNKSIKIYTHNYPDLDSLFSAYFFEEELNGRKIDNAVKKKIVDYIDSIDSGKGKNIDKLTFYALYSYSDVYLKNGDENKQISGKETKDFMFLYIRKLVDLLKENQGFNLCKDEINFLEEDFEPFNKLINDSREAYIKDKDEGNVSVRQINIHSRNDELINIKAAIWKKVPEHKEACYLHAREIDKVELTFVPQYVESKETLNDKDRYRVIVSLAPNPDYSLNSDYSLECFAKECEIWEQYYELLESNRNGGYTRNYYNARGSEKGSIFLEFPFRETDDPWYVDDNYEIVDAPGAKSILDFEKLIYILETHTKQLKGCSLFTYKSISDSPDMVFNQKEFFKCLEDVKEYLDKNKCDNDIPIIKVEADAKICKLGYGMMDYFFAYLNGTNLHDLNQNDIRRISPNLSIYVSQKVIVIFNTSRNNTTDNIDTGEIVKEISLIVNNRKKCFEIMKNSEKEKNVNPMTIRSEIIRIKADLNNMQKLTNIHTYNSCSFVRDRLNIDAYMDSITSDLELTYNEKRDRFYGLFKPVSLILAVVGCVNTINEFTGFSLEKIRKVGQIIEGTSDTYKIKNLYFDNKFAFILYGVLILILVVFVLYRKTIRLKTKDSASEK